MGFEKGWLVYFSHGDGYVGGRVSHKKDSVKMEFEYNVITSEEEVRACVRNNLALAVKASSLFGWDMNELLKEAEGELDYKPTVCKHCIKSNKIR